MNSRKKRKEALKEDIKHVLEELWDLEEEEPLYKIFTRKFLGVWSIQEVLQYPKAEIKDTSHRDDYDTSLYLQRHDVVKVHMIVHYQHHLSTKGILPEETETFRLN